MSVASPLHTRHVAPRVRIGRAFALAASGVVLAASAIGGALFATGQLNAETMPFYVGGIALAVLAGAVTLRIGGRVFDPRSLADCGGDAKLLAGRMQGLLATGMLVKLAALTAGMLTLRQTGAKFASTATFGVSFVGGALAVQLAATALLLRAQRVSPERASTS
jgi:hypothetical protein